jgi:fatty acid-binding protein DegV
MVEYFKGDLPVEYMAVMHAQAAHEAQQIAAALRKDLPDGEVTVGQIGSVLGTHTGPKALGIVYLKK